MGIALFYARPWPFGRARRAAARRASAPAVVEPVTVEAVTVDAPVPIHTARAAQGTNMPSSRRSAASARPSSRTSSSAK
jgi:hypothetical protein